MVRYPQEMIPIFDLCVFEEFQRMFGEHENQKRFQVRIFNLGEVKSMRKWRKRPQFSHSWTRDRHPKLLNTGGRFCCRRPEPERH